VKKMSKVTRRRRRIGGLAYTEEDDDDERDKSDATADDESEDVTDTDKRRGRRVKKVLSKKSEGESGAEDEDNICHQPKGRDFDLNIIRSELKGIEKAVKSTADPVKRETAADDKDKSAAAAGGGSEEKPEIAKVVSEMVEECVVQQADVKEKSVTVSEEKTEQPTAPPPPAAVAATTTPAAVTVTPSAASPAAVQVKTEEESDDVYEFKEPEPFEFEVRTKLVSPEDRNKSNRRTLPRIFDDYLDRSPEKLISPKKSAPTPRIPTTPPDKKEESRFRKTIGKKVKEIVSGEKKDTPPVVVDKVVAEIKESPVVNLVKLKSPEKEIPVLRVETLPPVVTLNKPVVDNAIEDMKKNILKLTPVVDKTSEVDLQDSLPDDSSEPPCLLPMTTSISLFPSFTDKTDKPISSPILVKVMDEPVEHQMVTVVSEKVDKPNIKKEEEEDPISAAIQRVIAQTSVTDDDSDNMDIFSNKKPIVPLVQTSLPLTENKSNSLVFRPVTEMHLKPTPDVLDDYCDPVKPVKKLVTPKKTATITPVNFLSTYSTSSTTSSSAVRKVCSKRKVNSKRLVLSKDDYSSDSDSSGEERLVIANDEESTSNQTSDDNVSLQCLASAVCETSSSEEQKKNLLVDRVKSPLPSVSVAEEVIVVPPAGHGEESKRQVEGEEEGESSLRSLLCEETIPGSPGPATDVARDVPSSGDHGSSTSTSQQQQQQQAPAPSQAGCRPVDNLPPFHRPPVNVVRRDRDGNDAAVVMDNTPPTTPESNLSSISGSPREERVGSSSLDNESSKSHRDSSEVDLDNEDHRSSRPGVTRYVKKSDKEHESPMKRKRSSRKRSESECNKRMRHSVGRAVKMKESGGGGGGGGSDSDDTSESSQVGSHSLNSDPLLTSQSPRPSKYHFYGELDPELDASQRIVVLQQKLQDLRKTYMDVKSQLAVIDRRRKKLRRREREEKAAAAAALAAATAAAAKSSATTGTTTTSNTITTTTTTATANTPTSTETCP
jgi:Ras-related protein Rab-1A